MSAPVSAVPASLEPLRRESLGLAAVCGAVVTWGFSNVIIKSISASGLVASFYRLWFALPVLWLLAFFLARSHWRLGRAWVRASLGGGLLFALHQLFFFSSLKLTNVANVAIIGALQPVLVLMVVRRLFGEQVSAGAQAWSLVAIAGAALVVIGSAGSPGWSPAGDALAVINLFAFTAYFLASKWYRTEVGATEYVVGMTTVSAIVILGICIATGQRLDSPRGSDWPLLVFLALVPGTLGHFLANWAHAHTSAFVISIMLLAVPVIAATGAAVFLGEALNGLQIGGGFVVLGAIALVMRATPPDISEDLAEGALEGQD